MGGNIIAAVLLCYMALNLSDMRFVTSTSLFESLVAYQHALPD